MDDRIGLAGQEEKLRDKFLRLMGKGDLNLALWKAASIGNDTLVEEYCARGAAVNWKNPKYFSYSPLHAASQKGHYKVVYVLIQRGADVNVRAASNESPLHEATHEGHQLIVLLLVLHGAKLSNETNYRMTPIDFAKQNRFLEGVLSLSHEFKSQQAQVEDLRGVLAKQVIQSCCFEVQAKRYTERLDKTVPSLDVAKRSSCKQVQEESKVDHLKSVKELQLELKDVLRLSDTKKRMYAKNIAELQKQITYLEEELAFVKQKLEKSYTENTRIEAFIDESVRSVAHKNALTWSQNESHHASAQTIKWRTLKSRLKDAEDRAYRATLHVERTEKMLKHRDDYVKALELRLSEFCKSENSALQLVGKTRNHVPLTRSVGKTR